MGADLQDVLREAELKPWDTAEAMTDSCVTAAMSDWTVITSDTRTVYNCIQAHATTLLIGGSPTGSQGITWNAAIISHSAAFWHSVPPC